MARVLIVGCGCHGRTLASRLIAAGHVVRGTTRDPDSLPKIEAVGAEAVLADPDRLATLVPALEHAGVVVLLLAGASGPPEQVAALHGPRLEALLHKLLDTTVRAVVYEARGTVDSTVLQAGRQAAERLCAHSRIPLRATELVRTDPQWPAEVAGAVDEVLRK